MEIKRGYVKWTDEDGVFHKEPLADHPELLEKANTFQKIAAEEVRRLNEDAEKKEEDFEAWAKKNAEETLEALESAPEHVLTTGDLTVADDGNGDEIIVPADEVGPTLQEALKLEDAKMAAATKPAWPTHSETTE